MSAAEEIEIAEARMNRAREALLGYVEQRKTLDGEEYRRLVARVKKAEAEFRRVAATLG